MERPRVQELRLRRGSLVVSQVESDLSKVRRWMVGRIISISGEVAKVLDADQDINDYDKNEEEIPEDSKRIININDLYLYPSNTDILPRVGELILAPWYMDDMWSTQLYYAYVMDFFSEDAHEILKEEAGEIKEPRRGINDWLFERVLPESGQDTLMVRVRYAGDSGLFVIPSRFIFRIPLDQRICFSDAVYLQNQDTF